MTQEPKTIGTCEVCGKYGTLTLHHIRLVTELEKNKKPICMDCHTTITQYENVIEKAIDFKKNEG